MCKSLAQTHISLKGAPYCVIFKKFAMCTCMAAQRTSFKKHCSLTTLPKDIYEPTPIGTFPFMS